MTINITKESIKRFCKKHKIGLINTAVAAGIGAIAYKCGKSNVKEDRFAANLVSFVKEGMEERDMDIDNVNAFRSPNVERPLSETLDELKGMSKDVLDADDKYIVLLLKEEK